MVENLRHRQNGCKSQTTNTTDTKPNIYNKTLMGRPKKKTKKPRTKKSLIKKEVVKPFIEYHSFESGNALNSDPLQDSLTFSDNIDLNKSSGDGLDLCSSQQRIPFNKKKVAPRSSQQFKVGPKFKDTEVNRKIFITSSDELVIPILSARVDRGFDLIDDEWIGYKRNYFTLVASFKLLDKDYKLFYKEKFHVLNDNDKCLNISCFALRLVSTCCEEDVEVNLIQHTAKRDRGPQYLPPIFPAIPGDLPSHSIIKQSSNIRNDSKIDQFNKLFFVNVENIAKEDLSSDAIINTYPEGNITTVARYERMQFSTSINYRKPALVNRHFILKVELLGVLEDGRYTVLAGIESPPLIVRGRSPSNYNLNRGLSPPTIDQPESEGALCKSRNATSDVEQTNNKLTDKRFLEYSDYSLVPFERDYQEKQGLNFKSSPISKLAFDRSLINVQNSSTGYPKTPNIYHDTKSSEVFSSDIRPGFAKDVLRGIDINSNILPQYPDMLEDLDCMFDPMFEYSSDTKSRHKHKRHRHKHKHRKPKHKEVKSEINNAPPPSSPTDEKENFELDIDSSFYKFKCEMEELQKQI